MPNPLPCWPAAIDLLGADCAGCLTDRQAVANLQLYGPTNFAEFINTTAEIARHADVSQHNQQYFVLLVLTDGVITVRLRLIGHWTHFL